MADPLGSPPRAPLRRVPEDAASTRRPPKFRELPFSERVFICVNLCVRFIAGVEVGAFFFLVPMMAARYGAAGTALVFVQQSYFVAMAFSRPLSGRLIQILTPLWVGSVSSVVYIIGAAVCCVPLDTPWFFVAGHAAMGLAYGSLGTTLDVLKMGLSPQPDFMTYASIIYGMGGALGALIGAWMGDSPLVGGRAWIPMYGAVAGVHFILGGYLFYWVGYRGWRQSRQDDEQQLLPAPVVESFGSLQEAFALKHGTWRQLDYVGGFFFISSILAGLVASILASSRFGSWPFWLCVVVSAGTFVLFWIYEHAIKWLSLSAWPLVPASLLWRKVGWFQLVAIPVTLYETFFDDYMPFYIQARGLSTLWAGVFLFVAFLIAGLTVPVLSIFKVDLFGAADKSGKEKLQRYASRGAIYCFGLLVAAGLMAFLGQQAWSAGPVHAVFAVLTVANKLGYILVESEWMNEVFWQQLGGMEKAKENKLKVPVMIAVLRGFPVIWRSVGGTAAAAVYQRDLTDGLARRDMGTPDEVRKTLDTIRNTFRPEAPYEAWRDPIREAAQEALDPVFKAAFCFVCISWLICLAYYCWQRWEVYNRRLFKLFWEGGSDPSEEEVNERMGRTLEQEDRPHQGGLSDGRSRHSSSRSASSTRPRARAREQAAGDPDNPLS